jgi:hypothetical protein
MRTQFLYVGLLGMLAGGVASTGCDDNHLGQLSDESGPVKLVRIMVQDSDPLGFSGAATDLLDLPGSPFSTAVACDDVNPCATPYTLGRANPDFKCKAGVCNDPLAPKTSGVNINIPVGNLGGGAGTQIRFIFNKLLNNSFETVTSDPAKLPGSEKKYVLAAGVAELDGPNGMPIGNIGTLGSYWDPTGSPTNTSDPVFIPFGPAIVIKPGVILAPNVTYTVKLTTSMITDRKGNPMADQTGAVVSGVYTKTFKTENIRDISAAFGASDITDPTLTIKPNDVIQIAFNTGVDETSVACTVSLGATPVTVVAFGERGGDPTMCSAPAMGMIGAPNDDTLLNVFPTDVADPVTAVPAMTGWAAGDYTIHCTGKDDSYGMGSFDLMGGFKVAGANGDPKKDANAIDNHALPSQCTGM